jgi:hypothetical protein
MIKWLVAFISGLLPIGINSKGEPKSFSEWFSKILWVVVIVVGCYFAKKGIDKLFPAPPTKEQTVQAGGVLIDVTHTYPKAGMFGCSSVKVYEYYKDRNASSDNSLSPIVNNAVVDK